ncbi:MAG TPA: Xaa-Pro peptidase family protein [Acetobacteraceae bacterium]|nr:Xaa-Pro peptidase family protein [Acetobacteraceae bacterium]
MDERRERTARAVRTLGADWAVLTSADAVCYATGHIVPIEAGASPFAGGPTTAFIGADGTAGLVAANVENLAAATVDVVQTYTGYAFEAAADLVANYLAAVERVATRLGVRGVLAVEPASFPAALRDRLPATRHAEIGPTLARARATKTPAELALLRRAAETAAVGQRTALQAARAEITELALFAEIRLAMENAAGERLPVTGDLLSGPARTAGFTGWPIARRIEAGDPLLVDLAPRVAGYWGDSCGSFTVGSAAPGYARLFRCARETLDLALEIMRPGLAIAELDRRLRERVARDGYAYPHHSGHSIGTAVHEYPRVVPYETALLEPGMVLMIEPGAYDPTLGGVRTEWMIEITATGCEPVAPFPHVADTATARAAAPH